MNEPYAPRISRRATLQWLAAATAATGLSEYVAAVTRTAAPQIVSKGYGTDPDLNDPAAPWPRTMTSHQLQLTAALADLILPGTASAPAPSAIGIADFVDEWISAPYSDQKADRTIILGGLEWLDTEASRRWSRGFLHVDEQHQCQLVDSIVPRSRSSAPTAQDTFFRRFRYVTVGGYYTTPPGFRDIGYMGNIPLMSYPPVTDKERAILDQELRKLGV